MPDVEVNGLLFEGVPSKKLKYRVTSLNYGVVLGELVFEEGPGWILQIPAGTTFIDTGDMQTIVSFVSTKSSA